MNGDREVRNESGKVKLVSYWEVRWEESIEKYSWRKRKMIGREFASS